MKLEWRNEEDIGHYECTVTDDDGYEQRISFWDYTCEYQSNKKATDAIFCRYHPEAYEISYCHGYAMRETFDDSHTLEDIKIWCEDYLLDKYLVTTVGKIKFNEILPDTFQYVNEASKDNNNYQSL